jgi:murein DD-endopeptidase MepM/ murein hydrolase activator NlpD
MLLPSPHRHTWKVASVVLLVLTLMTGTAPVAGATPTPPPPRWAWPIGAPRVITRPFIAPATPYSAGHRGIDLLAAAGATVYAPADGVVHFAGVIVDRPVISLEHPGGLISSFEPVASTLVAGTIVHRGDAIGRILGAPQSGHCGASCLHFGVRLHGQYVSPLNYLGGIPRSVLLPTRPLG